MKINPVQLISGIAIATLLGFASGTRADEIVNTLSFHRITDGISELGTMRMSANGGRIIYTTPGRRVHTINTDGTGQTTVFDQGSGNSPLIDISADGARIVWADLNGDRLYVANWDGTGVVEIAPDFDDGLEVRKMCVKVPPRITADGSKVLFLNSIPGSGQINTPWVDLAGLYRVDADGNNLQQVFSYREMATTIFGTNGLEYNPNVAWGQDLDISADGSRAVFTGAASGSNGAIITSDNGTLVAARLDSTGGPAVISGDGKTIAYVPKGAGFTVYAADFPSGNERALLDLLWSSRLDMNYDGQYLLAGAYGRGDMDFARLPLLKTDGSWRLDLAHFEKESAYPCIDASGQRFAFRSTYFSPFGQMWVGELNGLPSATAPTLSAPMLDPNYVLVDESVRSDFGVAVTEGSTGVTLVNHTGLREGHWLKNGFHISYNSMYDDGSHGDQTADDGFYSRADVATRSQGGGGPTPGPLTVRFTAYADTWIGAIDVEPFSLREQQPAAVNLTLETAVELRWESEPSSSYRVEATENLQDWEPVSPTLTGDGTTMSWFVSTVGKSFEAFRVVTEQ